MPGPLPKYLIKLTPTHVASLQHLSTCYTAPFAEVQRARVLLLAPQHPTWRNAEIARHVRSCCEAGTYEPRVVSLPYYDSVPPEFGELKPVGRLDADSHGLQLLSNDGAFIYKMTHPGSGKFKTYRLRLAHNLTYRDVTALVSGVKLEDGLSRVEVTQHQGQQATVRLGEGRNRQLRRTFGAIGCGITDLQRVGMGDYELGELPEGRWQKVQPL